MKTKVPWTKTLLEKFVEEGLLTKDEEKILRTRIAGWSIAKQSMELGMSTATVSRIIKDIKQKYSTVSSNHPDFFPNIKPSKYEDVLDTVDINKDVECTRVLDDFQTVCGKDVRAMSAEEIINCQKSCPYDEFYMIKNK